MANFKVGDKVTIPARPSLGVCTIDDVASVGFSGTTYYINTPFGLQKELECNLRSANSRAGGLTVKNALDYSNIRRILSKFNYKTSFGNLVEFVEAPEARENNLVIIGYKESAGFGGGSEVSISQALATKIGDELKKHYRVDSISLKGKRLVLTGDFSGMKARNSSACNGGWVGGPSLPGMRTIADYPNYPKSQRGVEFQKWLSTIDGKDLPSDWRALLTKKGYVVPNAKVTSTNQVVRKALNAVACNASPEAYKAFVAKWQPKIRECWKTLVQFDLELPSDMQIGPQFDVAVRVIQHAKEFLQGEAMRLSK